MDKVTNAKSKPVIHGSVQKNGVPGELLNNSHRTRLW